MPAASKRRNRRQRPSDIPNVGQAASQRIVARGMATQEKLLLSQFKARLAQRGRERSQFKILRRPMLKAVEGDRAARAALQRLRRIQAAVRRRHVTVPVVQKESPQVVTGSYGMRVVPPYSYQWSWKAWSGVPGIGGTANRNTGALLDIFNGDFEGPSAGSVRTAVGIYFRPITPFGALAVWSNPSFGDQWDTFCHLSDAHSDGFVGLYVGRYDLAGNFVDAPIVQRVSLWADDSWFFGAGFHEDQSSGFPLGTIFFVDSNHWYAIWVWSGCDAWADGWGSEWSGSGADAALSISVPSISWLLL